MSLKGCNTTNSPLNFLAVGRAWGIRKKKVMCCDQVVLHLIEVVTKIEATLSDRIHQCRWLQISLMLAFKVKV